MKRPAVQSRLRAPGPALVISLIALCVALGGTAAASGLISGKQITNHSIAENKLTKDAIKDLDGTAYSVHVADQVAIPGRSGYVKIASLSLPVGSYIVTAKTVLHNGSNIGGTCRLRDTHAGTLDLASGSTELNTLSMLAALVTRGSIVQLQCNGQFDSVSAGFTHLVAIKVGTVRGN